MVCRHLARDTGGHVAGKTGGAETPTDHLAPPPALTLLVGMGRETGVVSPEKTSLSNQLCQELRETHTCYLSYSWQPHES